MDTQSKTAIVLGATGLIGGILLQMLLEDDRYGQVRLFSRSSIGFKHPKMKEYLVDLANPEAYREVYKGDEVFCCIGTTKSKTPNKANYRAIDYGIPVQAAALCKENGIGTFIVVSSLGANPKSKVFYNRTKGQMEVAVLKQQVPNTYILQPSLLAGKREERRIGEWIARQVMRAMNLVMVGPLDRYRSIYPEKVASCMIWLANNPYKHQRIPSDEIRKIALRHGG